MGAIDNLSQSTAFQDIYRRLKALEVATPSNSSSIGSGGLRVHSGGVITIENGGLRVTGTAEIIGQLIASGSIIFNGPVRITGPFDVEGLTKIMGDLILAAGGKFTAGTIELNPDGSAKFGTLTIDPDGTLTSGEATINPDGSAKFGQFDIAANGNLDSKGTLDIKGKSTLQDDLEVKGGGKVTVGGMKLQPNTDGGAILFGESGRVSELGNRLSMAYGGAAVQVLQTAVLLAVSGASGGSFRVDVNGVYASNLPTTMQKSNLYVDPSTGKLYRSVAD